MWCPATEDPNLSISFGNPGRYSNALAWPLTFDNDVRPSIPLLRLCLEKAGFEDIRELNCPEWLPPVWQRWFRAQKGYLAFRTAEVRTALVPGANRRRVLPGDAPVKPRPPVGTIRLVVENLHGFNIITDGLRWYAIHCGEGEFNRDQFRRRGYSTQHSGRTLAAVIRRLLRGLQAELNQPLALA